MGVAPLDPHDCWIRKDALKLYDKFTGGLDGV